jgi:hypothetical protein
MFSHCDICGDPTSYFKVIDEKLTCMDCADIDINPLRGDRCDNNGPGIITSVPREKEIRCEKCFPIICKLLDIKYHLTQQLQLSETYAVEQLSAISNLQKKLKDLETQEQRESNE